MLSVRTIAGVDDRYLAAVWRGDKPTGIWGNWLEAPWCDHHVAEPEIGPFAVSV